MHKKRIFIFMMVLIMLMDFIFIRWYCNQKIDLIEIPVANRDIPARTKIDETLFDYVEIPSAYIDSNAYLLAEDIVDKYTDLGNTIRKGSPFYIGDLYHEKELPDAPSMKLKKGQTAFPLSVDLVKFSGNTISEDQKVDVYVTIEQTKGTPIVDNVIKAVRVIGIKDRNGIDIQDETSSHVPYVVLLAINDDLIQYLKVAERIGDIDILAPSTNYADGEESLFNDQSEVLQYIR